MEAVAMTPMAQGHRELQCIEIQLRYLGRLVDDKIGGFLQLGKAKMDGRKNFLLSYFNLDFIIFFLLYFRELQFISTDNKAMRW